MKRVFDILLSGGGMVLLSPLFLVVSVLILLDSGRPVFFKHKRVGGNFKPFYVYKFRTMVQRRTEKGLELTVGGDRRITPVGRILRKTKLDEFPQLLNVLRGEMSVVGPRPEVESYVRLYEKEYREILKLRPGITDLSSLTFRNEEEILKNQSDPEGFYKGILLPEKIRLAREYMGKASFTYDLQLIGKTLCRVILC